MIALQGARLSHLPSRIGARNDPRDDGSPGGPADTFHGGDDMAQGIRGSQQPCSVEDCTSLAFARGWCRSHYQRHHRAGLFEPRRPLTIEERFWAKVDKRGDDECWLWTASLDAYGYGLFAITKTNRRKAHRFAYELLIGPIPNGLRDLDHLCHTNDPNCNLGNECSHRRCVNPRHLEPVTHQENLRRGRGGQNLVERARAMTHCKWGHPFAGDNLRVTRQGWRVCRACQRRRDGSTIPEPGRG